MGVVYKARQVDLDRIVVLKMVLAGSMASAEQVTRFHAEAKVAAKVQHPHVIPVYETGHANGLPYLVMQFVEGCSLHDRLRAGPLAPDTAARIVATVARGGRSARRRHRPSRPEAVQHPAGRSRSAVRHRLRAGEAGRRRKPPDAKRRHPGHAAVHGARAAPRPRTRRRPGRGRLFAWRDPLRMRHGPASVSRANHVRHVDGSSRRRGDAAAANQSEGAAGIGTDYIAMPGKRSGPAVPVGRSFGVCSRRLLERGFGHGPPSGASHVNSPVGTAGAGVGGPAGGAGDFQRAGRVQPFSVSGIPILDPAGIRLARGVGGRVLAMSVGLAAAGLERMGRVRLVGRRRPDADRRAVGDPVGSQSGDYRLSVFGSRRGLMDANTDGVGDDGLVRAWLRWGGDGDRPARRFTAADPPACGVSRVVGRPRILDGLPGAARPRAEPVLRRPTAGEDSSLALGPGRFFWTFFRF